MSINAFKKFQNGDITPNEFAVYVAVNALSGGNKALTATTPQIARSLNGLSRHAVARALRSLDEKKLVNWSTNNATGNRSTIEIR